jgi:hypothetical protein
MTGSLVARSWVRPEGPVGSCLDEEDVLGDEDAEDADARRDGPGGLASGRAPSDERPSCPAACRRVAGLDPGEVRADRVELDEV